jgi:hypothetical protein
MAPWPQSHPRPAKAKSPATDGGVREMRAHLVISLGVGRLNDAGRGPVEPPSFREFRSRRDGMIHAMDGGLWLHRHVWKGRALAHLVSTNRELLLAYGRYVGIPAERLQYKPLKDPRTGIRRAAWHWDLGGPVLPPPTERY